MKAKRSRFGWTLTLAMVVVYYGLIILVAFDKHFLAQRSGSGVMTLGLPLGFFVIVLTIIVTAVYVRRANRELYDLTSAISAAVLK